MRDLIIKVSASDEEAARFEGRMAMVVAVSEEEAALLRANIIYVNDFLLRVPLELKTLLALLRKNEAMDPNTAANTSPALSARSTPTPNSALSSAPGSTALPS